MNNNLLKAFENPHISKILNEVLDKFDKRAKRANKISFALNDKNFLALYFPNEFNEDIDLEYDIKVLLNNDIFELKNATKTDFCEYFDLREKPVLLHIFGKSVSASKILFIENLETFTTCIESKNKVFDEYILINAHGYKATAKRLRVQDGSKLFFNNDCKLNKETKESFISWFYSNQNDKEVYFWGDLDFEGISILEKLQKNFTSLKAFIPAYDLMIKEALDGNSHFCEDTNKQNQKLVTSTSCKYINDEVIPFLKEKKLFLDQEFIDVNSI